MDAHLAATYTLIHSFLRKHSHSKAALAVKKAAKDIVVLKDDIEIEGPSLDIIVMEWKAAQVATTGTKSSSSDSDSEDSSDSSDSDSSNLSDSSVTSSTSKTSTEPSKLADADGQVKAKVFSKAASSSGESSSDSESSSSSSSDSDSESSDSDTTTTNSKPTQKPIKTKISREIKVERQSSQTLTSGSSSISSASEDASSRKTLKEDKNTDNNDSSDSGLSSSDSENDASVKSKCAKDKKVTSTPNKEVKSKTTKPKQRKSCSSSSSSSDSDSSTDEDELEIVKPKKKHITTNDSNETPAQATKKRRITEDGTAVVTATTETVEPPQNGPHSSGRIKANGKPARKSNTPFQRVNPEKVDQQVLLQNNGYMAKAAPSNDYGARAHQDLIVTRGAGFRKEKNKKKRGSYKGGTITLESHSFKFT